MLNLGSMNIMEENKKLVENKYLINPRLSRIEESITIWVADKIRGIERAGQEVIKLQTGDPDFNTPGIIISAAREAMRAGHTHYSSSRGLPELREAIACKLNVENKIDYRPQNEIIVTHGGIHAVFIAITSLVKEGDEVLIIDPCWMPYVSSTLMAGGKPVRVDTDSKAGFRIKIEDIENKISDRTKLLVLNSPGNPTGRVFSIDALKAIAKMVEKYKLFVIADEVYEKLVYDEHQHISFASLPGMKERTITVNSFSKTFAMTGWRLGYLAAPSELCGQILKASQYSITNVAPFIQKAGVEALINEKTKHFVENMIETYSRRRKFLIKALSSINGLNFSAPSGAFYFMIDISSLGMKSMEFSEKLLESKQVGVVPGIGFGESAEGFVRITFAASDKDLTEGCKRIKDFFEANR